MKKLIKLLFLLVILVSCGADDPPQQPDFSNLIKPPIEILEPHNFSYGQDVVSYFQNFTISNNSVEVSGRPPITFQVFPELPDGMNLNPTTGEISGTPSELINSKFYTVTASNEFGSTSFSINITVKAPPPLNLSYNIQAGEKFIRGTPIDIKFPSVDGDITSYDINPRLPDGLVFNRTTGEISGTPLEIKSFQAYQVTAFNNSGQDDTIISFEVIDQEPTDLEYPLTSFVFSVGNPIPQLNPTNNGGVITFYTIDRPLPAGLFIDFSTGIITGTPLEEIFPQQSFTITGNNTGGSVSKTLNFQIRDVAIETLNYLNVPDNFTKDEEIIILKPTFTGGKPNLYTITPELPEGLSFNSLTGEISGTPTSIMVDPQTYTVTASNSRGSVSHDITLRIIDIIPDNISFPQSSYTLRQDENFEISSVGNTGGEVTEYTITPELPSGLSLNSDGKIIGRPTEISDAVTYLISAKNSGGVYPYSVELEILPFPNYDIDVELFSKSDLGNDMVSFSFNIKNQSLEFDNSVGINFTLPISIQSDNENISADSGSGCFLLSELPYNSSCSLTVLYDTSEPIPESLFFTIFGSDVYSKAIDLLQYLDLSPKNLNFSVNRPLIRIRRQDIASDLINDREPVLLQNTNQYASVIINNTQNSENIDNFPSNNLSSIINEEISLNDDPDGDSYPGVLLKNNTGSFIAGFNIEFDILAGIDVRCSYNPPYEELQCGDETFNLRAEDINTSESVSINLSPVQGSESEIVTSESIPVSVYSLSRIWTTFEYPEDMLLFDNDLYFSGLVDQVSLNSRKMLKYDIENDEVVQVSRFTRIGDDKASPIGVLKDDLLLMKGRNPERLTTDPSLYIYNTSINRIQPLRLDSDNFIANFNFQQLNSSFFFEKDKYKYFFAKDSDGIVRLYEYDFLANTFTKLLDPLTSFIEDENGLVDYSSFKIFDRDIIMVQDLIKNGSQGKKLLQYDRIEDTLRKVTNINGNTLDDNIYDITLINDNVFFMAKNISGNTALYKYNTTTSLYQIIFNGLENGNIHGVINNRILYSMNNVSYDALYEYNTVTNESKTIFKTQNSQDKIFKIVNQIPDDQNYIYFILRNSLKNSEELIELFFDNSTYIIKKITRAPNDLIRTNDGFFNNNLINWTHSGNVSITNSLNDKLKLVHLEDNSAIISQIIDVEPNSSYNLELYIDFIDDMGELTIYEGIDDTGDILLRVNESNSFIKNNINVRSIITRSSNKIFLKINGGRNSVYYDEIVIKDSLINQENEIFVSKDISIFNYDNKLFFTCDTSIDSLCVYDPEVNKMARITFDLNFKLKKEERVKGIIFKDGIVYLGTYDDGVKKAGVYKLCKLDSQGKCIIN